MMYPFLTLDDQTEIVHSQLLDDGSVKVYVEKPDEKDCFHYATCFLPEYRWEESTSHSESNPFRPAFTMRRAFCQNTAGKMFPASLRRRFRSIKVSSHQ